MKHAPFLGTALIVAVVATHGGTTLGGAIDGISFDEASGPYMVEKDIVVPKGKKVVMDAGTVLMFKPYTGLRVDGELVINGAAGEPVVFTSIHDAAYGPEAGQLPNAFDWNGVLLSPESDGLTAKHLHVKYSVYGIKAQTENVHLGDALFVQNGQYHFTANDKIQYVQDSIPYSYNMPVVEPTSEAAEPELMPKKEKSRRSDSPRSKLVFRYTCLGAGLVGAGLGTVFAIRASDDRQRLEELEQGDDYLGQGIEDAGEWDGINESRRSNTVGAGLAYGIGAAFLIGFGVTFFF